TRSTHCTPKASASLPRPAQLRPGDAQRQADAHHHGRPRRIRARPDPGAGQVRHGRCQGKIERDGHFVTRVGTKRASLGRQVGERPSDKKVGHVLKMRGEGYSLRSIAKHLHVDDDRAADPKARISASCSCLIAGVGNPPASLSATKRSPGQPAVRGFCTQAWRSPRNAAMVFPSMSEVLSRFSERLRAPHRLFIAFGGRDESRWRFTQAHDALVGDGGPDCLLWFRSRHGSNLLARTGTWSWWWAWLCSRFPRWRSWVCSWSWICSRFPRARVCSWSWISSGSGLGLGLVGARLLWLQLLVESASRPLGLPILLTDLIGS